MSKLKQVDNKKEFVLMEQELLEYWKENGIVKKYMEKNKNSGKIFSFMDGPITANYQMGLHHAWGRAYKDFVARYKTMKGFEQRYQMGFDCQGLWVEVEVEKELGFNSKKDIYGYGIGKFTDACKERVNKYAGVQTNQSIRLGMFMDWENSYYTMSDTNNLYIWKFLKMCKEKDLLYKAHSSTTWCPRCETGLSQHEQADGYKDVVDTSVFVKFRILGREKEYLLAWTTTPWTLSANVMLAVNSNFEYVKVKDGEDVCYLAKKPAQKLGFKKMEDVKVTDLLGLEYESLYDIPAQKGIKHTVVEWELVTEDDGTGIVHVAPGCGQEDYELGVKLRSAALSPLSESGVFLEGYGELSGKYAHDVKDSVIEFLRSKGLLFKTEEYTHSYPHCWRCKTKCLFRLENNWFINISKIRPQLKEQADMAKWIPEFVRKRMQDWLLNMGDWMISRKRFYGLSLPFYECECGEVTVVGSKEELKKLAVKPRLVDKLPSMHRPWVDEIEIKCPKCGKNVKRITDVGDCWLDAGVIPFSTLKYFEEKEFWQKWFPADFIVEMVEQVRLWYYSQLVFSVIFEGTVPYKQVLSYADMRDANNERMSKTKKNFIPFDEAADKVGSDLIRWTFARCPFGRNIKFGWEPMEDTRRQFFLPFWNSYTYFVMYAGIHDWKYNGRFEPMKVKNFMDKWIVSNLHNLVNEANRLFDGYKFPAFTEMVERFVLDLSTWYIRRSRDRFKTGDMEALNTLHYVLVELIKLMAPVMPFVTEDMYHNLVVNLGIKGAKESIHLETYSENKEVDEKLLKDMSLARELSSMGLKIRDENRLKVRQPLQKAYMNFAVSDLINVVKEELNVKEVEFVKEKVTLDGVLTMENNGMFVSLDTNMTDELKEEGMIREVVRQIQDMRKKKGLKMGELVDIVYDCNDEWLLSVIKKNEDAIGREVSANTFGVGKTTEEAKIGDVILKLSLK